MPRRMRLPLRRGSCAEDLRIAVDHHRAALGLSDNLGPGNAIVSRELSCASLGADRDGNDRPRDDYVCNSSAPDMSAVTFDATTAACKPANPAILASAVETSPSAKTFS